MPQRYPLTLTLPLLLITLLLVPQTQSFQFSVTLPVQQRFCFFQVFEALQKYTYVITSLQKVKFVAEVSYVENNRWKAEFLRESEQPHAVVRVDKLASSSTTYSFCFSNRGQQQATYKLEFHSGLAVLQLHQLPDSKDSQNLQRELTWLQNQTMSLTQRSQNLQQLRRINSQLGGMVGIKMIVIAVVGLAVIAVVNVGFYRILRHQLKKRKLI